jgi:anthranilate synthase component 2
MRILIIDNYDSFVYNIVQVIHKIDGVQLDVLRNDDERLCNIEHYDVIIISPGPGVPSSAGRLMEVIKRYHTVIPMLGICLGFQAIAQFFGAKLINLQRPLHGHESELTNVDLNDRLYQSIQQPIIVGHYHSWVVDGCTLPACLKATAYDESGNLMSFTHRSLPIYGVQYHPESIITNSGPAIIKNFITFVAK